MPLGRDQSQRFEVTAESGEAAVGERQTWVRGGEAEAEAAAEEGKVEVAAGGQGRGGGGGGQAGRRRRGAAEAAAEGAGRGGGGEGARPGGGGGGQGRGGGGGGQVDEPAVAAENEARLKRLWLTNPNSIAKTEDSKEGNAASKEVDPATSATPGTVAWCDCDNASRIPAGGLPRRRQGHMGQRALALLMRLPKRNASASVANVTSNNFPILQIGGQKRGRSSRLARKGQKVERQGCLRVEAVTRRSQET